MRTDFTVTRRGRFVTITAPQIGRTIMVTHGHYYATRVDRSMRWAPTIPLTLTPGVLQVLQRAIQRRLRR
jgi:hypothetical protein